MTAAGVEREGCSVGLEERCFQAEKRVIRREVRQAEHRWVGVGGACPHPRQRRLAGDTPLSRNLGEWGPGQVCKDP